MRLGVDTGGTFTDFVWLDDDGRFQIHKQLSTPHDPSEAILSGVDRLRVPDAADVVHGSTVATNALLERRGARTALITTAGFGDILAIGRQNRTDLYALVPQKAAPLVPAEWRFEIAERVSAQGQVVVPLDESGLTSILARIAADDIESVAVCLLFSFLYPEHENRIRERLEAWLADQPARRLHLSLSSDILPEYREFERTAATVINAYVAPLMSRYLTRLARGLHPRRLAVMQSNGGVISAETAGYQAARTALSGPAGGVVGAMYISQRAGFEDIITFDMGGTSTDVALCPGRLPTTSEGEIAGLPLRLPIIDIHTVGAGGGSLAYVDPGGALHVGPKSAGADPGPSCYGREIGDWRLEIGSIVRQIPTTTTDANLVLGRLDADHFLGGGMQLNLAAARKALSELGRDMGVDSPEAAAWGVIQVANANMERAIRRISVERGFDPRRFTLVAFGGAGPLHACELAEDLRIPRVLIPAVPGVLSALGMLVAAPAKDYSLTVMKVSGGWRSELDDWLKAQYQALEERALADMSTEGHEPATVALRYSLDMRYVGQSHELTIPYAADGSDMNEAFHAAHQKRYGYHQPQAAVEIVNLRLAASTPVKPPAITAGEKGDPDAGSAVLGVKDVWFDRQPQRSNLIDRSKLRPGHQFAGPAVVVQYDTTTVVPPEWQAVVDSYGNIVLTRA